MSKDGLVVPRVAVHAGFVFDWVRQVFAALMGTPTVLWQLASTARVRTLSYSRHACRPTMPCKQDACLRHVPVSMERVFLLRKRVLMGETCYAL